MAEKAEHSESEVQRIFVMRHGERKDARNPQWKKTAVRPYDTPITSRGELEAHQLSVRRYSGKVRRSLCVHCSREGLNSHRNVFCR